MQWPHIDDLEVIADWRESLTARIRRARLRYELASLSPEEIIKLSEEAAEFGRVCRAMRGEFE
jgi:hypothetical protein